MADKIAITAVDAAKRLSIGRSTFWKLVADGRLPQPIRIGGSNRWLVSEIEPFTDPSVLLAQTKYARRPKSVPLGPGRQHLYRHFDEDGRLLYVGISLSAVARLAEHKQASHWFWQIARIEVTAYATRDDAAKAERISIQREKPVHNIAHAIRLAA